MILFKLTLPTLGAAPTAGLTARILSRFQAEAGPLIVTSIQGILGHDALYSLSPEYEARKSRMPGYRSYPGKSAGQPLILTGEGIYEALQYSMTGDTLTVEVDPSKGSTNGFDYAEYWQSGAGSTRGFSGVDYLGKGFDLVEDQLADILIDIVVQEMLL